MMGTGGGGEHPVRGSSRDTATGKGQDRAGIFQRLQEAGRLECGEWLEIRAATPSGHATSHTGLDRRPGEGNREGGGRRQASLHHESQETRCHEEKNHKDSLVPALGGHWEGQSGPQRRGPLHLSSPRELAWHGHSLGSLHAWGRGTWVLGEEEQHMTTSLWGGPRSSRPPRWYTRVCHWLQRGCLTI